MLYHKDPLRDIYEAAAIDRMLEELDAKMAANPRLLNNFFGYHKIREDGEAELIRK